MDLYNLGVELLRIRLLLQDGDTPEVYRTIDILVDSIEEVTGRTVEYSEEES